MKDSGPVYTRSPYFAAGIDIPKVFITGAAIAGLLWGLTNCKGPTAPVIDAGVKTTFAANTRGELFGQGPANSTVSLFDQNGKQIGSADVGKDGAWRLALPALATGAYAITAKAYANGVEATSNVINLTVGPAALAASTPALLSPLGGTLFAPKQEITVEGTGTANTDVQVCDGDKAVGKATIGDNGKWSVSIGALDLGAHLLSASPVGGACNVSSAAVANVVVEAATAVPATDVPPATATVVATAVATSAPTEAPAATATQAAPAATATADPTKSAATATVAPTTAPAVVTATVEATTTASSVVTTTAEMTPTFGSAVTATVDITSPASAVITESSTAAVTVAPPVITSIKNGDTLPADKVTVIKGKSDPKATVHVFDGPVKLGETKSDAQGNWVLTPAKPLDAGKHDISAVAADADGNTSSKDLKQVDVSVTPLLPTTGGELN